MLKDNMSTDIPVTQMHTPHASVFAMSRAAAYKGQEKASDPRELEFQLVVSLLTCSKLSPSSLEEQQVLLTAELSLQPPFALLNRD